MMTEYDTSSSDIIAMNLTIAALERFLSPESFATGDEVGREVGAIYRAIHEAVDEFVPEEEEDEDDEEEEELVVSGR